MRLVELFEQTLVQEGVHDKGIFKAIFMAGAGGSGKGYVVKQVMPEAAHGLRIINSDKALEYIQTKAGGSLEMMNMDPDELEAFLARRDRAKNITQKIFDRLVNGRVGIVIDGTGREFDRIARQRQQLEDLGYDTSMVFVNTSQEVALARNNKRKRKLDNAMLIQHWHEVQDNMGKYQSLFGNQNFKIIDNNDASEDELAKAFVEVRNFVNKPIDSPIAKAWIAKELELKKQPAIRADQ